MTKTGEILLIFFVLLSIILSSPKATLTQSVSTELYETEEDLKEGLENGDLTYDEYLELLDLIRSKVNVDSYDTTRLLFVPDVTSFDLVQRLELKTRVLSPLAKTTPFVRLAPEGKAPIKGELIWQSYQGIEENAKPENLAILKIEDKRRFSFDLTMEQDDSKRFETQRRSLRLFNLLNSADVVLGNFEKRIGLGLNLGYHPLFRYSLDDTLNIKDSFLYPIRGRYNGINLESKSKFFRPGLIISKNRFGNLEDKVYALHLSFIRKRSKVGILLTRGELKNSSTGSLFRDDCGSVYLDLFWRKLRLTSELAWMWNNQKGFALNFGARGKSHSMSGHFWWYSPEFVHPHGGGVSNPDYESIYLLDGIDFSYRTRQKGERGILLKSVYRFSSGVFFDFALNQWRKNPGSDQSLRLKTGGGYRLTESLLTEIHLLWNDNWEVSRTDYSNLSWDWVYWLIDETYLRLRTNYRTKKLAARTKKYGDLQIKIGNLEVFPFNINAWLRYTDPDFSSSGNTYWNLNFEEKLDFLRSYSISVRYLAYLYPAKDNRHTIRVRWEMRW